MRRFPARESRWRLLSPQDASIGAVPFQEAKWARLANRRMSPDVAEQPGGTGGSDTVQLEQPAAGSADELGEFLLRGEVLLRAARDEFEQQGVQPVTTSVRARPSSFGSA